MVVIHDAGVFDTPESYSFRFRVWYKTLQHALVKTGAQIVTVSRFSRDRIADRLGLDPARVAVMYEGADHIQRVAPDPDALERYGLHPRQFALVVGTRVAHKNLAALQEADTVLERRGMIIAVVGGTNAEVFQDTRLGGLRETPPRPRRRMRNCGRCTRTPPACCFRPATKDSACPRSRRWHAAVRFSASQGGAVEEICGDAALYFACDDRHAIGRAVGQLLDEPGLADALRARGRVRAAALSWDTSARVLADIVRRAC